MATRRLNTGPVVAILLVIVSLPVRYMGTYYVMLDPNPSLASQFVGSPEYRSKNEMRDTVFLPAHEIDRLVRRENWHREPLNFYRSRMPPPAFQP